MSDRRGWIGLAGLLAVGLALSLPVRAAPAADPAFGDWLTQAGDGKVRVGPCAADPARACGALIWMKPPPNAPTGPVHDVNNPDPALRSRPMLGILIIRDFTREAPGHWGDGKIYDPNDGKTYKAKMSVAPDGALKVSGCVLVFCKAQTWTRAN
ncbi:MAG TPA: DUF2147 domain-containing protein [Phenylobacterium sp.]|jgi:uncharacterized protein (DUF2147 family)|uniref:DUF2147 domain-containing protein n=1 Tax=Phenylobacterium sp. TaxID=1871053 RepID=UPI002D3A943B|nr:DUF2147 domain-containing protein [Phenylobacterium sp.]HZZ68650.1 DUF2147 domain-containing protein [Phenylobacterium sp.]